MVLSQKGKNGYFALKYVLVMVLKDSTLNAHVPDKKYI